MSPSTWVVDLDGGDSWIIVEMNIVMIGCGGVFHVECQLLLEFNLHGSGSNNIIFMARQYWPQISGIFFSCLCNSHLKFKPLLHLIEIISMDWSLRLLRFFFELVSLVTSLDPNFYGLVNFRLPEKLSPIINVLTNWHGKNK